MLANALRPATFLALVLLVASSVYGDGEGVLLQKQGDRVVVGFDDDTPGGVTIGARVFSSFLPSSGLTTDPSFVSLNPAPAGYETLPVGEDVFWDFLPLTMGGVTSNLFHWDGQGGFAPQPSTDATLSLYDPSFGVASVHGDESAVPGRRIGTVTGDALALHAHRYWELSGDSGAAAPGVYVASLRLWMDELLPTEPIYVALATFGTATTALDETVNWLNENADSLLLEGDYNFDGSVDGADYGVWSMQYGATTPQSVDIGEADGNGDGVVDAADYTLWRDAASAPDAAVVPEPATLLIAATLLAARASRRSAHPR